MTQSWTNVNIIFADFFDTDTPLCGHKFTLIFFRHGFAQINTDSSIVSNHGFGLTGKNGGEKN